MSDICTGRAWIEDHHNFQLLDVRESEPDSPENSLVDYLPAMYTNLESPYVNRPPHHPTAYACPHQENPEPACKVSFHHRQNHQDPDQSSPYKVTKPHSQEHQSRIYHRLRP